MALASPSTPRPYITCRQLLDFIYDYLEGTLPADERAEFERHMAVCPSCVHYLDTYRKTLRISRAVLRPDAEEQDALDSDLALPEPLVQSILAAIGSREDPSERARERTRD